MAARSTSPLAAALLLLTALLLAVAAPTGARAATIASSVSGFEGGPALSSDGRVVVGERRGNGALRIRAIDPRSLAATDLAAFGPLADPATYPVLSVAGSGGIVTALIDEYRGVGPNPDEQAQPSVLRTRTMTLLPGNVPLGVCGSPLFGGFAQLDAAGGGDGFVATVGDDCSGVASEIRLRTANGSRTIRALPGPAGSTFQPQISNLRAAGPFVAWLETTMAALGSPVSSSIVVARGATGEVLLRTPLDAGALLNLRMGLGADGTAAVVASIASCVIGVVSPAAPALRRIALPANLCAGLGGVSRGQGDIALAGGQIVYATHAGYGVVDATGTVRALPEAALRPGSATPVAFDGRTAYVVRPDCDADRLLAVDAGMPAPIPVGSPSECPVRRAGPSRLRFAPAARVTVALRCAKGCRGTLRLVQQRRGGRERVVGEAGYASAANPVLVRVPVARYARALAGCSGGLGVQARFFAVGDDHVSASAGRGKGLGGYRISSRSPCQRGGGPAFTARKPGPRP